MEERKCRGLIIQNNPFSYATGNGKTIASMFSEWTNENLAQIFTSNLQPDFTICKNYYKISDANALQSFLKRIPCGHPIYADINTKENEKNHGKVTSKFSKGCDFLRSWMSESSFVACLRDLMWRKSNWNNVTLYEWLDEVQPTFVFLSAGNLSVFYDMAQFICEYKGIPLFIHIGDDYFIYRSGLNPWKNLQRRRMSKKLSQAINKSSYVIAICDKMSRVFQEKYGGRYYTCMNSIDFSEQRRVNRERSGKKIKLVYAGNLGINRWKVLNLIGRALEELRAEGIEAQLDIYSSYTPTKRIQQILTIPGALQFCGSVYGEELNRVKGEADILVHVEAFEKRYRQLTYTAMSTKISEYMGSGQTILAVGPEEAASIEFLKDNNAALVVTNQSTDEIKEKVRCYITEPEKCNDMCDRAVEIARQRFSKTENAKHIYEIISGAQ